MLFKLSTWKCIYCENLLPAVYFFTITSKSMQPKQNHIPTSPTPCWPDSSLPLAGLIFLGYLGNTKDLYLTFSFFNFLSYKFNYLFLSFSNAFFILCSQCCNRTINSFQLIPQIIFILSHGSFQKPKPNGG